MLLNPNDHICIRQSRRPCYFSTDRRLKFPSDTSHLSPTLASWSLQFYLFIYTLWRESLFVWCMKGIFWRERGNCFIICLQLVLLGQFKQARGRKIHVFCNGNLHENKKRRYGWGDNIVIDLKGLVFGNVNNSEMVE